MRRAVTARTVALALAICCIAGQARAQISGTVTDSAGLPILMAHVTYSATGIEVTTNESGSFSFKDVIAGSATLSVKRLGFEPLTHPLSVANTSEPVTGMVLRMNRLASFLPTQVVAAKKVSYSGRLAGYYQRLERKNSGYFITRTQIDQENPRTLAQLLHHVPAISERNMRAGGTGVRMRGRNCWPLVWLDSTPMPAGDVDLNGISPQTLQGIELYLGSTTAPARFTLNRDGNSCGTIVLWSRGPDTEPRTVPTRPELDLDRLVDSKKVWTAADVDVKAELIQNSAPTKYPASLFAEGTDGSVIAEFVVDSTGRVDPATIGIVSSTHPLFSEAVQIALRTAAYRPASKGGAKVSQLVQQPFTFTVRK